MSSLGRSKKQDDRPRLWLAKHFLTSPLKPLNGIQLNFTMQDLNTLYQVCVFGPIWKSRWPPWSLIGWDIFDFSSETAGQNLTKLDKKQDLNVLFRDCVFGPIRKTRWPPWFFNGWYIFLLFLWNCWKKFNETWQEARSKRPLYQVCSFRDDERNKMTALGFYWMRHFRLLFWNHWREFNETLREARSQCPVPSLCFSGRSEKQDDRRCLWLAETLSTSPRKLLKGIQWNMTGSKI